MTILPLLSLVLTLRKGFVYLLDVDIYTYSLLFSSLLQHISYHFALHLAPFYPAFSTILPCVLHHFTLRFAAKRGAFSSILHFILVQIAQNLRLDERELAKIALTMLKFTLKRLQ